MGKARTVSSPQSRPSSNMTSPQAVNAFNLRDQHILLSNPTPTQQVCFHPRGHMSFFKQKSIAWPHQDRKVVSVSSNSVTFTSFLVTLQRYISCGELSQKKTLAFSWLLRLLADQSLQYPSGSNSVALKMAAGIPFEIAESSDTSAWYNNHTNSHH